MRHIVSTAIVAVVVSLVTVTAMTAVAQDPAAVGPAAVSNINADRVDGKHAVGAGASAAQRAGKLVATNSQGRLPSNILNPDWDRMIDVPAGFADGVDNAGVTGLTITRVQGSYTQVNANAFGTAWGQAQVDCPAGSRLVGGGYWSPTAAFSVNSSTATDADTWTVFATLLGRTGDGWVSAIFRADAMCLGVSPAGALTVTATALEPKPARTTRRR